MPGFSQELFVDPIPPGIQCSICFDVARDAHRCSDEHLFCNECIHEWLKKQSTCPIDRKPLCDHKLSVFRFVQDIVRDLHLRCTSYANAGCKSASSDVIAHDHECCCQWVGKVGDLDDHLSSCDHTLVPCSFSKCPQVVRRKDLEQHAASHELANCRYCDEAFEVTALVDHLAVCQKRTIPCPNGCGEEEVAENMDKHRTFCELEDILCPFKDSVGCEHRCKRQYMKSHMSDIQAHYPLLMNSLSECRKSTKNLEAEVNMLSIRSECAVLAQDPKYTTGYFSWNNVQTSLLLSHQHNIKSSISKIGAMKFSMLVGKNPPAIDNHIAAFICLDSPEATVHGLNVKCKLKISMKDEAGRTKVRKDFHVQGKLLTNLGYLQACSFDELRQYAMVTFEAFMCYNP